MIYTHSELGAVTSILLVFPASSGYDAHLIRITTSQ